ncbi:MAG: histidine--tRNA ligase [Parcubacteria group bacterium]|nr:histidine--tRNA ligase [Parcubacteria group bacterium]
MKKTAKAISTEPYKGVRDFYPEDMYIQKYMFQKMREVVESFGYIEYGASILEPSELYQAKSGEEIVNDQTYSFKDRGDRDVTLRPEMTPTVARMVARKKRDLSFPIRWYSIPNLFRYEQPQRGRVREHFQLNVDLFGSESINADLEVIKIAYQIMKNFGAKDSDFQIRINDRKIASELYKLYNLNETDSYKLSKVIDKKNKISKESFEEAVEIILKDKASEFMVLLTSNEKLLTKIGENNPNVKNLISIIENLTSSGITNVVFDQTLMRGFDYYTGTVFEIFDTNPENKRSIFGGGRYDELLDIFDAPKMPAVGFGMGDVTTEDFLETHNLLPEYKSNVKLYICKLDEKYSSEVEALADKLRKKGLCVAIDLSDKKVGDQIKTADKQKIPFVICIGEDEVKKKEFKIKNLATGEEKTVTEDEIASVIHPIK